MKKLIVLITVFFAFNSANSQILDPVKWTTSVEKKSDANYILTFEGTIENDWHLYSQFTSDGGPLPLEVLFKESKGNFSLIGKAKESKTRTSFNDIFEVNETYFEKKAQIKQEIQILNPSISIIEATLNYQVCKEVCINQEKKFSFTIPSTESTSSEKTVEREAKDTIANDSLVPSLGSSNVMEATVDSPAKNESNSQKGLWAIFIFALLGGIGATFTPCVYPMIPMTVSFFLKQSQNKAKGRFNAFFYGLCIVFICFAFTIPFHIFEGINRDIFSQISTNVYLNIFFFLIFFLFSISFFGAFEITMPSGLTNKVDKASDRGGLIGVFFMALTLIIVSFSCIGPALGFVFGTSLNTDGGATILSVAMTAFGIGLALPFVFFALTPSLLGNLPKSGGWLNTVKVVFGFVELALAFKFLSNADIGMDLHLLNREIFIAIWIAIFGALSLYLFGKITLPHDNSSLNHISVERLLLGLTTLAFTVYLVPGLWGAPVKLISAFPPPMNYSESPMGFGNKTTSIDNPILPLGAVYGVHNLISFEDYNEGLAYAKKENKVVLIDFTGKQCVNCRLMENNVWSDGKVLNILKNEVILISLYGDDKKELPKSEWYVSKENGSEINTIGEKWSEFQIQRFNNNSRPFYVLMDPKTEKVLISSVSYTPNILEYETWLKTGISKFKR